MIRAKNIIKEYGNKRILDDISILLNTGEINVLFGPSGCGKTTLCRVLTLLDYPESGTISIGNKNYIFPANKKINEFPYPEVNIVFQQLFLWPHLTNEENIKLSLENNFLLDKEKYNYLLKLLDIQDIIKQYPNQSSLGQKQRVAIARVLMLNPKFIFFDEITSALDIIQTNNIVSILQKLKKDGIGILLITHDINVIKKIADRVFFMDEGKIIESGTIDIFSNPQSNLLKKFIL